MSCECTEDCGASVVIIDTSASPPDNGGDPGDGGGPNTGVECKCPETVVVTDPFDEPIFEAHNLT